jgi:Na+-driven multidrug efflux pump
MSTDRYDPVKGDVLTVFVHYAIPSVIGMLAVTSAGIIDGIFVGHFVGAAALAAINISMPVFALLVGLVIMFAIGGSVMCGKSLGEGDLAAASLIFSKMIYATLGVAALIGGTGLVFLDQLVVMLGANEELHDLVRTYLQIFLYAAPLLVTGLTLDYFVRTDGRPLLASSALVAIAVINIVLDWLFIVKFGWGLRGAAWATAIAYGCVFFILVTHIGLVTLLFNWVMITRLGVDGVAAFTIIGYLLMIGLEVCYGISESLQPTVSKNLGARQPGRIARFTVTAVISSFGIGLLVSALFILIPENLIGIFLREEDAGARDIALAFIALFWPAFLFNGMNITLASYLTALHKPLPSAAIALSRSLVLPATGLALLPLWWGDNGVYLAIPIAEALTFVLALLLVSRYRPSRVVAAA